jgi:1,4-dihydroxy-2-naphthoate octaprenyltransferase
MAEAGAIADGDGARPGALAVWIQAIRAPSLSAAAIPVLLGVAVAARAGFFSLGRMLLALVGAMAIQAGTNLINDYYDFRSGADSEQSLGPSMVIQRGLLSADQVWRGGIAAFAIVMGAYFVMAMNFSAAALWASIPLGFLVAGILHANNIRDIESDTRHGKRTVATILGRAGANYELIALDVAAYTATIIAVITHALPWIASVVFITIPRALDQIRIVTRSDDPKKLNLGLFRSIQLHMEFGLLMIAAFLVAAFFKW